MRVKYADACMFDTQARFMRVFWAQYLRPVLYSVDSTVCFVDNHPLGSDLGSCVLKASVDRVSGDTIGRYGDRHSANISTDTWPICRSSVGRHAVLVNRPSVDTIGRYVGRHSANTSADMLQSTVASVSVDCR